MLSLRHAVSVSVSGFDVILGDEGWGGSIVVECEWFTVVATGNLTLFCRLDTQDVRR